MSEETKGPIDYCKIPKRDQILMSPEGVEEKVISVQGAMLTLTQGGKYRVYMICPCPEHPIHGAGTTDNMQDAETLGASVLAMIAGMELAPLETMKSLFRAPKS